MTRNVRLLLWAVAVLCAAAGVGLVVAANRGTQTAQPQAAAVPEAKPIVMRPEAKAEPKPERKAAAEAKSSGPGVVAVFEGGKFGEDKVTETPKFTIDPDWSTEIEIRGEFRQILLSAEKPDGEPWGYYLFLHSQHRHSERQGRHVHHVTNGGQCVIQFVGNGVWKVTIRQGTGKL